MRVCDYQEDGAQNNAIQFMPTGMENGEYKVLVHGSGP